MASRRVCACLFGGAPEHKEGEGPPRRRADSRACGGRGGSRLGSTHPALPSPPPPTPDPRDPRALWCSSVFMHNRSQLWALLRATHGAGDRPSRLPFPRAKQVRAAARWGSGRLRQLHEVTWLALGPGSSPSHRTVFLASGKGSGTGSHYRGTRERGRYGAEGLLSPN